MKWSIIIPSYNAFPLIRETISSIQRLDGGEAVAEIVIVDSSDDTCTRQYLRGLEDPRIKLILLEERRVMPARQRNIGARHAGEELLAFVDSDVCLDRDWLARVGEAVEAGCEIGSGSLDLPDRQRGNMVATAQLFLQCNEYLPNGKRRAVGCVPAPNLFCTRELFDRAGGFPDLRASEDVLFCKRAAEMTPVWFVPDARVTHCFRTSLAGLLRNQLLLGEYIIVYRKLLYDRWYYRHVFPVLLLPGVLLWKGGRIAARVARTGPRFTAPFLKSSPLFVLGLLAWGLGWLKGCINGNSHRVRRQMTESSANVAAGAAV